MTRGNFEIQRVSDAVGQRATDSDPPETVGKTRVILRVCNLNTDGSVLLG